MKNIYEDGTLPGTPEIPQVKRQSTSPPTRPKKQVTPTPMQQEKKEQQLAQQQMQYQPMPPYGAVPYPYVPVGTDANGQVVYTLATDKNGQPVYPQGAVVYPYAPYMPLQTMPMQPVQSTAVPEQGTTQQSNHNPGTRVLYQSPDFDMSDSAPKNTEVGASFAQGNFRKEPVISQEDIELEEVSIDLDRKAPELMRKTDIPMSEDFEIDEVNFDPTQIGPLMREKEGVYSDEEDFNEKTFFAPKKKTSEQKEIILEEKKKLPKSEIIRRVVLAVSIVAIVIAAGMLINEYRMARENENVEEEASNLIIEEATKNKDDDKTGEDEKETTEVQLTPEQQWAKIKQEYPKVIFPANIQLKYAKLYAENQDFVGYLSADGVKLNLPVVQANDDEEYLKKNFYGASTKYGCPFVTHLNTINPLDMNTVIFGHHMNNGTIFGALDAYKSISGFKKAPVITFNTLYKDYSWKIIAAFVTNAYGKDDVNNYVFPYYFTSLSSYEKYAAYLNELSQRSLYDTGVDVVPTDKILTLSTCSHEFEDARFVVVARLVRPGESASVDTSKAVINSSPRYPQAYYDAKKIKTNPYKNASQWEVG